MNFATFTDRTAVLFIGVAVGVAISQAFINGGTVMASPATAVAVATAPQAGGAAPMRRNCPTALAITPELNAAIRRGETIDVGVFGDSFGDGLWAAVYQGLRAEDKVKVHRLAKNSTGFTRYQSLNLLDDIRVKLDSQPVDIAVISFGANDTQGVWSNGNAYAYMTDAWKSKVGERIDAVVELMRARGISIVWIGLPRMRESGFESQIGQMNAFNAELMCSLNVPFIDTVPRSTGSDGVYASHLPLRPGGEPIKVRAGDGVHMTMTGYGLLIPDLIEDISDLAPDTAPAVAPAATRPAAQ